MKQDSFLSHLFSALESRVMTNLIIFFVFLLVWIACVFISVVRGVSVPATVERMVIISYCVVAGISGSVTLMSMIKKATSPVIDQLTDTTQEVETTEKSNY
jgi:hypothetical protein